MQKQPEHGRWHGLTDAVTSWQRPRLRHARRDPPDVRERPHHLWGLPLADRASAVMMLVEHQELALADPITRWFPALPAHWQDITVHQLLSHASQLTVMDSARSVVVPRESVAATVNENVPLVVVVPAIEPFEVRSSPSGRVPARSAHV